MKSIFLPRLSKAVFLGNILEHFDKVLFGLMAPFLAPLFFPKSDPIVALILIYLPMGFIARPIGALYWSKFSQKHGPSKVLLTSILGMSATLFLTAFLPTYENFGIFSAFLLHFKRGLTCFFASGEGTAASIILIDQTEEKSKDITSSYYEVSSMIGVFLASLCVCVLTYKGAVLSAWRPLFFVSSLFGFFGFFTRKNVLHQMTLQHNNSSKDKISLFSFIKKYFLPLITIAFVTGFICANFRISTKLLNGYLPLVTSLSHPQVMLTHTLLIFYDAMALPLFGLLSKKIGKEKVMYHAFFVAVLCFFPLFSWLSSPTLGKLFITRMCMISWGIALSAPFAYWCMSLAPKKDQFKLIALSRALGEQCIGAPAISVSLILYKKTHMIAAPAFYLIVCGAIAGVLLLVSQLKNQKHLELAPN